MELYTFGLNAHSQLQPHETATSSSDKILKPTMVLSSHSSIKILYSSWCDAVVASTDISCRTRIHYFGTALTESQVACFAGAVPLAPPATVCKSLLFSNPLGSGLSGLYYGSRAEDLGVSDDANPDLFNTFILFPTEYQRTKNDAAEVDRLQFPQNPEFGNIDSIVFTTGGRVAVYILPDTFGEMQTRGNIPTSDIRAARILEFNNETEFKTWIRSLSAPSTLTHLRTNTAFDNVPLKHEIPLPPTTPFTTPFSPVDVPPSDSTPRHKTPFPSASLHATSTTFAVRSFGAKSVQTWTQDARYPSLLGRPLSNETPANSPHPIPYLSETPLAKVETGSWMSAAISQDGELYVWGVGVLQEPAAGLHNDGKERGQFFAFLSGRKSEKEEAEQDSDEEDEFVKVVDVKIEGREARVAHVGIGNAHIVIAAEADGELAGMEERRVFAAGRGECGQLGIGECVRFVGNWREVQELKGRIVREVRCEGWSSWVVVEKQDGH